MHKPANGKFFFGILAGANPLLGDPLISLPIGDLPEPDLELASYETRTVVGYPLPINFYKNPKSFQLL